MVKRKGQSTLEYALIIAVVVGGLMVMQHYVKRGYQGKLKSSADDMGTQFDPLSFSSTINVSQYANVTQTVENGETTTTQQADQYNKRTGNETQGNWTPGLNVYGE
jgi:hypothetical protein